MGFWDWLRPKAPRTAVSDRVWLSATARLAGLAAEVSAAGGPVPVLAHFPQSLREAEEALAAVGLPGERVEGPISPADLLPRLAGGPARPLFALAGQLRPADPPGDVAGEPVRILVAERHFLRTHDDAVVRFADGLGRPAAVTFFLALDDPVMKAFAGDWVSDVLRRLGMREGEAIDSPMVLRRFKAAQLKNAVKARGDEPADSPAGWLERNMPGG